MNTPIQLHDFSGGIHPAENKSQSNGKAITFAGLPEKLILPLSQHIGAQPNILVSPGDTVLKGQLIAEIEGLVSSNLHAPTSGQISNIANMPIAHPSGFSDVCIEITPDGQDKWTTLKAIENYQSLQPNELVKIIQEAGITGMGGAGFPTHVKLSAPAETIDTLIINAAECEPYITADDRLIQERAEHIIKGIDVLEFIIKPKTVLIGIEDNKPNAIAALNKVLSSQNKTTIKVAVIPTKYPSGGEKQLIQILTGKEVPSGGLPTSLGIICQNIGTAYAVYNAIFKGQPLISRITTITGNACPDPKNYEVLIGTPVKHLLDASQADMNQINRLVMGGPMMGFTIDQLDTPIIKASNCIIAATKQELPDPAMEQACIRCGMCTEACPAQLLPQQLYWFAKSSNLEQAEKHNIADCIECGACSFVCPSNIPLVQYYRFAKGEIKQANADKVKSDQAKLRFEARLARQERELAEKEAKRKARAQAAAKKQAEKKAAPAPASVTSSTTAATKQPDIDLLQKKFDTTKAAVQKSKEKLKALEESGNLDTEKSEILKTAISKAQDKMKEAAKSLAEAKKIQKTSELSNSEKAGAKDDNKNSPDRLKNKLDLAQSRLETAKSRLAEAKAENTDMVAALEIAVNKQSERVKEAETAYQESLKPSNSLAANKANTVTDIETLKQKVLAAQSRVEKADERLGMARQQNLDTVDALATGLEKQKIKLDAAKNALNTAIKANEESVQ